MKRRRQCCDILRLAEVGDDQAEHRPIRGNPGLDQGPGPPGTPRKAGTTPPGIRFRPGIIARPLLGHVSDPRPCSILHASRSSAQAPRLRTLMPGSTRLARFWSASPPQPSAPLQPWVRRWRPARAATGRGGGARGCFTRSRVAKSAGSQVLGPLQ